MSDSVMISDWFAVPRVPAEVRNQVYGDRTPDPRVELVALTVKYWMDAHATRSMTRERVLAAMTGRITAGNVWDLVSMLVHLGLAEAFFDLAATDVDRDGAFRRFLLGLDPDLIEAMRHYSAWYGINPKLFLDGFVAGVAESFATVVVDLGKLVALVGRLQQEQMTTLIVLSLDPRAGLRRIAEQAVVVREAFTGIVAALDPATVPDRVLALWRGWEQEFARHLDDLDPFAAGRTLGRIAGDLYQLLTGLVQLARLIGGVAVRAAIRYAPLLLAVVRGAAADLRLVTAQLAALLLAIGQVVIAGTPRVGLAVLRTLFPPQVLGALIRQGRALLVESELTLTMITQAAHAEAFGGAGSGAVFSVMVSENGKPVLMASVSETVPSAGRAATRHELETALDEILTRADDVFRDARPPKAPADVEALAVRAVILRQLEQRLTTVFNRLLQTVAWTEFRALRQAGPVQPWRLGQQVHRQMAGRIGELLGQAPGLQAHTEKALSTVVDAVRAASPELAPALKGADAVLKQTIAQMIMGHPDRDLLLRLVGFTGDATKAGAEKALARQLADRFGWKAGTTVGELRSDLLLVDPQAAKVTNVDWTSSTNLTRFEKTWGTIADDLGGTFDGDWAGLADAYRKAGKDIPPEVAAGLEELTAHAVRETVVRQAALSQVFTGFFVTSHEMAYQGLHALFKIPL